MNFPRLSKPQILSGLQCHKRLWLSIHWDDLHDEAPTTDFEICNRVGESARYCRPHDMLAGRQC